MSIKRIPYIAGILAATLLIACGDDSSSNASGNDDEKELTSSSSSLSTKSKSSSSSLEDSERTESKEMFLNPEIAYDSIIDRRDGKVYKIIRIGKQTWMAQNLNYSDSVATPSLIGKSWCYDDDPDNCTLYGRLYTWAAAMDSVNNDCGYGVKNSPVGKVQGICPSGWHVPSETEWNELFSAVGGSRTAGSKLMSRKGWDDNENDDKFGFSSAPAGNRHNTGLFYGEGSFAEYWSSTVSSSYTAYHMDHGLSSAGASLNSLTKLYGFYIRCVKD